MYIEILKECLLEFEEVLRNDRKEKNFLDSLF